MCFQGVKHARDGVIYEQSLRSDAKPPPPPGGDLLYKLYRYVSHQRVVLNWVWFSREPRERINVFVFSTPNE